MASHAYHRRSTHTGFHLPCILNERIENACMSCSLELCGHCLTNALNHEFVSEPSSLVGALSAVRGGATDHLHSPFMWGKYPPGSSTSCQNTNFGLSWGLNALSVDPRSEIGGVPTSSVDNSLINAQPTPAWLDTENSELSITPSTALNPNEIVSQTIGPATSPRETHNLASFDEHLLEFYLGSQTPASSLDYDQFTASAVSATYQPSCIIGENSITVPTMIEQNTEVNDVSIDDDFDSDAFLRTLDSAAPSAAYSSPSSNAIESTQSISEMTPEEPLSAPAATEHVIQGFHINNRTNLTTQARPRQSASPRNLPFECPHHPCSKKFRYQRDLNRHLTTRKHQRDVDLAPRLGVTQVRFFCKAPYCKFRRDGFGRKDHYERHVKTMHPELEVERKSKQASRENVEAETHG